MKVRNTPVFNKNPAGSSSRDPKVNTRPKDSAEKLVKMLESRVSAAKTQTQQANKGNFDITA